MEETVIMFSGVLAGWFMLRLRGETQKQIVRWNGRIQTVCVACIIGIMGVNLGSMDALCCGAHGALRGGGVALPRED